MIYPQGWRSIGRDLFHSEFDSVRLGWCRQLFMCGSELPRGRPNWQYSPWSHRLLSIREIFFAPFISAPPRFLQSLPEMTTLVEGEDVEFLCQVKGLGFEQYYTILFLGSGWVLASVQHILVAEWRRYAQLGGGPMRWWGGIKCRVHNAREGTFGQN